MSAFSLSILELFSRRLETSLSGRIVFLQSDPESFDNNSEKSSNLTLLTLFISRARSNFPALLPYILPITRMLFWLVGRVCIVFKLHFYRAKFEFHSCKPLRLRA